MLEFSCSCLSDNKRRQHEGSLQQSAGNSSLYQTRFVLSLARGGCQDRSKAQGSGPCPVGVRGFKSHPPHSQLAERLVQHDLCPFRYGGNSLVKVVSRPVKIFGSLVEGKITLSVPTAFSEVGV